MNAAKVKALSEPGVHTDGNGLTLRIAPSGGKSWVQRATIGGKQRNIGLGGYPGVGLAEARQKTLDNLKAIREGHNPIADRQADREASATLAAIPSFQEVAETVIAMRRPTWSSDRHAKQWTESLTNHVYPVIGSKRVDAVTTADAMAVIMPIWTTLAETSTRVRQRMESVFDFAIAQGWRTDNPVVSLGKALPRRARLKRHHPALHYGLVPGTVAQIHGSTADPATKLAFKFLILTASRAGEVRNAVWDEIDLESKTWVIPPGRMKARREHRVPLAERAIEILKEAQSLDRGDVLIFPARRSGKPLSNKAFDALLRRLEIPCVPHGFRSSFRDWIIEATSTPWAVGEAALAHRLGNSVESAYARTDLFEKRRELMDDWATFVAGSDRAQESMFSQFKRALQAGHGLHQQV